MKSCVIYNKNNTTFSHRKMFCDVFLIHRCWQWTNLIERTFHLDNVAERFAVH